MMRIMVHCLRNTAMALSATTPKKATDITLSGEVLSKAKAFGIDISQAHDQFLWDLVRRERRWQDENAEFIAAYNRTVETEGLPLGEWRGF
jgi:antitoxin CcdA